MSNHWLRLGALVLAWGWTVPATPVGAETGGGEAGLEGDARAWAERGGKSAVKRLWVDVQCTEEYFTDAVVFRCAMRRDEDGPEDASLRVNLTVRDGASAALYSDSALLREEEDQDTCQFVWETSGVPPGAYMAHFEWQDRPEYTLGWAEWVIRKISLTGLRRDLEESGGEIHGLQRRLDDLAVDGRRPPYLWMRLDVASDFAQPALDDLVKGRLRRAALAARYLRETADSVRAQLTFGEWAPELEASIPRPRLDHLEMHDGTLTAGGQPVFLFGWAVGRASASAVCRVARYGLNFAVIDVSPRDMLLSETETAEIAAMLDPVFDQAEKDNVSVAVNLLPEVMPQWALDKWPEMIDKERGCVDVAAPASRALVARHYGAVLPYLAGKKMLQSVSLADRPEFRFVGEQVRQGFLASVKGQYPDRHAMNRSWKCHLADFDAVDIGPAHLPPDPSRAHWYQAKCAFQYDWQTYHQCLGAEYLSWLVSLARGLAPEVPLVVKYANDVFEPGASRRGVNHESVAGLTDVSGCTASVTPTDRPYAITYPGEPLLYTFLRSLAPDQPVVNLEDRIVCGEERPGLYTRAYVHSVMWESAMSGLSGSAAWTWDRSEPLNEDQNDLFSLPDCLEGYAQACLDLNRLSRIVSAFQTAPADLTILWSLPSKIIFEGDPYLDTARDAVEGCSFSGYKVRFITEDQCIRTKLADTKVLVLPDTLSLSDEAFSVLQDFVAEGGITVRLGTPIPYNERGYSRHDSLGVTQHTLLIRGLTLPTEYMHAIDALLQFGTLPLIPRTVNAYQYPLEGVHTRYAEVDGAGYLYLVNLRAEAVFCYLTGLRSTGRDLIQGCGVTFPMTVEPLRPMLIRLDAAPETPTPPEAEKPDTEGTRPALQPGLDGVSGNRPGA